MGHVDQLSPVIGVDRVAAADSSGLLPRLSACVEESPTMLSCKLLPIRQQTTLLLIMRRRGDHGQEEDRSSGEEEDS